MSGVSDTGAVEEFVSFPMARDRACPFDPPPEMMRRLAEEPASRVQLWDGSAPWVLTRHSDIRAILADERVSADSLRSGFPHRSAGNQATAHTTQTFLFMDDPEHRRIRSTVTPAFSVRRVESLRQRVAELADELIDEMLAASQPADLMNQYALPLPSLVICELLGVPYEDHDFFQSATKVLIARSANAEEAAESSRALIEYMEDLLARKRVDPREDILSELAIEHVESGQLTASEAAAIGFFLVVAGHETTSNMIALGTLALLEHPDQWAEIVRTPDDKALVAAAVEELLRYLTITHTGRRRVAIADIELGEHTIRAGDGIICANDTANRDPRVFDSPNRLDIHRDARRHVAFSFGVHQCLGQPLARVELQVAFAALARRIPTLRLASAIDDVGFKDDSLVYGVEDLMVAW